jgi:hypothetical protein
MHFFREPLVPAPTLAPVTGTSRWRPTPRYSRHSSRGVIGLGSVAALGVEEALGGGVMASEGRHVGVVGGADTRVSSRVASPRSRVARGNIVSWYGPQLRLF